MSAYVILRYNSGDRNLKTRSKFLKDLALGLCEEHNEIG